MGSVLRFVSLAGAVVLLILVIIAIMAIFGSQFDNTWTNPPV